MRGLHALQHCQLCPFHVHLQQVHTPALPAPSGEGSCALLGRIEKSCMQPGFQLWALSGRSIVPAYRIQAGGADLSELSRLEVGFLSRVSMEGASHCCSNRRDTAVRV